MILRSLCLCHVMLASVEPVLFLVTTTLMHVTVLWLLLHILFLKSQLNYSQIEKEAFSIIFGLKRFHQFLAARLFTIITDHRPLFSIFAPDKPVPIHTACSSTTDMLSCQ